MSNLRQRLQRDEGFTLIELLVVIVIIGILLAIAVPSYLGFKDRANQKAADADVRAAMSSAEAYYADNGSYTGMTVANLTSTYDSGLKLDHVVISPDGKTYCIDKGVNGKNAYAVRGFAPHTPAGGSAGDVTEGALCGTVTNAGPN